MSLYGEDLQKFLDGLKPGDLVAVRDRRIGSSLSRDFGYRRYLIKHITPKRNRFDLQLARVVDGKNVVYDERVVQFNGRGYYTSGGGFGRESFLMEPFTEEVQVSITADNIRQRFHNLTFDLEEASRNLRHEGGKKLTIDEMKVFNFKAREILTMLQGTLLGDAGDHDKDQE